MKLISHPVFLTHDTGMHPENAKRLEVFTGFSDVEIPSGEEYLGLYHTSSYIESVKESCRTGGHLDPDTVVSPQSYTAAVQAVGATVLASQTGNFALVRPPGHHAHPDHSSGFCIFNNIGIAVEKLTKEHKRVAIVDFDGHTGDGTEKFFYRRNDVLYLSVHQSPAFPQFGIVDDMGEGEGAGFTVNIPLPPKSGDDILSDCLTRFMPVVEQFKPDVVAVSAGFDGHQHDLLLNLRFTIHSYYLIGKLLSQKFPFVFATLEGGYNTDTLRGCVLSFLAGYNCGALPAIEDPTVSQATVKEEYEARAARLSDNLSAYWKI